MLLIALAWVYTLFLSYIFGLGVNRILLKKAFPTLQPEPLIFIGLAILSALAGLVSLAINIGLIAHAVILFAAISIWWLQRPFFVPARQKLWQQITCGNYWVLTAKVTGTICLLAISVQVPSHGDSDFYHAQAVQWAEQFRVVPGLGNLFGRLAFNSALFPLQALFSFHFLLMEPLHLVNSFLVWIFFLWLINLCYQSYRNCDGLLVFYLVFLFASFLLFRGWVSSVAPDIAAGIFTWAALLLYLQEAKNQPSRDNFWAIGMCSLTAVTIKISTLPIMLLPALLFLSDARKRNFQRLGRTAILSLFILAPFLIRNVIISGYLLYPVPSVDLFSVDWKIPHELVLQEKNIIHAFARIPGKPAAWVLSLSVAEWLPQWVALQALHDLAILFVVLAMPLVFTVTGAWRKVPSSFITVWIVLYAGIVFWFINAPSFRFGYAFLMPALALSAWYFGKDVQQKFTSALLYSGMAGISIMLIAFAFYLTNKSGLQLPERLFTPAPYPAVLTQPFYIGSTQIRVVPPEGNCGNTPVPCVNTELLHPNLRLRGPHLQHGFYIAD